MEFFLDKIEERKGLQQKNFMVHFEMVPSIFPPELRDMLTRFPPGTLRLEIGFQTLNPEIAKRIGRHSNPQKELETIRFLREKTNAVIHADLIAGLPGEDLISFGNGFDALWFALSQPKDSPTEHSIIETLMQKTQIEIQLGILKLLPGAPIRRHNESFGMHYNPAPPYEIIETAAMSAADLGRVKNYARFWELIVNRGLIVLPHDKPVFTGFMALSESLLTRFGRNWGIDKSELKNAVEDFC
jgi:hypothetical protein